MAKFGKALKSAVHTTRSLFNLRGDTNEEGTVEYIRANVDFKSANAWTLVFAIVIASVGLNTNSTAVVIGAMLISPLMGPIVGTGLGLGIHDFDLIRRSLRNLGFAVLISVVASTLYFLMSPLSEVQSELLARTRPTFFDVIIAVFGGAAGIVALSRREKSNALPGVAIATALMPPLCTAGFGIANGQTAILIGALYLFLINSVFICISTFVFVRYLKFKKTAAAAKADQRLVDRWVYSIAVVVIIPSLAFAWLLQRENSFRTRANAFIKNEVRFEHTFLVAREIEYSWSQPKIQISLIGESLSQDQIDQLKNKLPLYRIRPDTLFVQQSAIDESLEKRFSDRLSSQDNLTKQMDTKLMKSESELQRLRANYILSQQVTGELELLFPKIKKVKLFEEPPLPQAAAGSGQSSSIQVEWKIRPDRRERLKVSDFLGKRIEGSAKVVEHVMEL